MHVGHGSVTLIHLPVIKLIEFTACISYLCLIKMPSNLKSRRGTEHYFALEILIANRKQLHVCPAILDTS